MSGVASGSLGHFTFPPLIPCCPRPTLPSQALRRPAGAGSRRRRAARSRGARPRGSWLPADRPSRRGKDDRGADPRHGAQLPQPRRTAAIPAASARTAVRIWSGAASLDVVEIDAASNRGVDDARELRERAMYAASQAGHHKVYIVDEAHMLTREAWNALLKILEEPPPGVVFVFATTEPQKIAATAAPVLSRLQRFDFRRIGPAAIRDRLAAGARRRGHRRGRGRPDSHRAAGGRRHARRALGARPVPELRRGCGHRGPGARGARAGRRRALRRGCSRLVADASARRASSRWWTGWSTRART